MPKKFPAPMKVGSTNVRELCETQDFAPGKAHIVRVYEEQGFAVEFILDMERRGQKIFLDVHTIGTNVDSYRWPQAHETTKERADAAIEMCYRVMHAWPYEDINATMVKALLRYINQLQVGQIDRALGKLKPEVTQ